LQSPQVDEDIGRDYVTVIVRMVVAPTGALIQGEVISLDNELVGRFRDWEGAVAVIRAWLARRQRSS
jgi:hypothetical protein